MLSSEVNILMRFNVLTEIKKIQATKKKRKNPSLYVLILVKSEVTKITACLMENTNWLISDEVLSATHQPELQTKQRSYCTVAPKDQYCHGKWEH